MSELTLDHVYKRYGDVTAVDDLNIKINDEEFLVLVGPSGCGKTTALRMIAGLEEISDGDIFIGDRRVNEVEPKDRDIAMVFQNYALYPHMSVYDNMAFGLKLRRTPKQEIERRVTDVAERLGLEALLKRKPKQLSGGQRQRVALGRAIVREPQVFLMDEPLSNLDAQLRIQTRADLIRLHARLATTTVYVTHDQVEAMTMGDRIAIMKGGVLQQLDTPQNVYDHPTNIFVAGFIGSPPMNFFRGQLSTEEDDSLWVHCQGVHLKIRFQLKDQLEAMSGREVVMGVRPDAIAHPVELGHTDTTGREVDARVDVIEPLGSEVYVYLMADGAEEPFVARMSAEHAPRPGTTMKVIFNTLKLHFFDPATEESLSPPRRNRA